MKMKFLLPIVAAIALGSTGVAQADSATRISQDDVRASHENTTTKRVVKYKCMTGGNLKVTYGFNSAGLPTFAQAYLNGKVRYMPINLNRSDDVENTAFGDDDNFRLFTERLTLKNYRTQAISTIQSPGHEILRKSCTVR